MVTFNTIEQFEKWLDAKEQSVKKYYSCALAMRITLRLIPLLSSLLEENDKFTRKKRLRLLIPIFRSAVISWSVVRHRADDVELANAARLAAFSSSEFNGASRAVADAASASIVYFIIGESVAGLALGAAAQVGQFAANSFVIGRSVSADATALENGLTPKVLASRPLWPDGEPDWAKDRWLQLKSALTRTDDPELVKENWQVWTDWYEARRDGRDPWPEEVEVACALIPDEIWEQGPAAANAEIKRIRDEWAGRQKAPSPEPTGEYEIRDGMLGPKLPRASAGPFDGGDAGRLHERLKQSINDLFAESRKVANSRTALFNVVREYKELIEAPLEQLDIQDIWTVGESLLAHAEALAPLNAQNTMAGALEPDHYAALKAAAALHSGFSLGFEQGRTLAQRKHENILSGKDPAQVVSKIKDLFDWLRNGRSLVEEKTRNFIGALGDTIEQVEFKSTQALYPFYAVSKNVMIAVGETLKDANSRLSTLGGAIILEVAAPGITRSSADWVLFVSQNTHVIMAYAEMFPEFKYWIGHQIDLIRSRQEKNSDANK